MTDSSKCPECESDSKYETACVEEWRAAVSARRFENKELSKANELLRNDLASANARISELETRLKESQQLSDAAVPLCH